MAIRSRVIKKIMAICGAVILAISFVPGAAFADSEFSVSPMTQKIILIPGEEYRGTFNVTNPASNTSTFNYRLDVEPFYVDENHATVLEGNGDFNQIVDWIEFDHETGAVEPNSTETVYFTVNVPETAPAGGQYATIRVTSNSELAEGSGNINLQNVMAIAHLIYAEVAGSTERGGEITDVNLPSFLLSGDITATSVVENKGNVHGTATYTMKVFPLFSDEEVYTNEEDPEEKTVMPARKLSHETVWGDTPAIGIFNVIYTVEFEGAIAEVSKMVIICPVWLLFVILFIVVAIIIWLVVRIKARKGDKKSGK